MDYFYSAALRLFLDKNDPLRKSYRVKTNQNNKKAAEEIKILGTMKSVGAARNLKITVKRAVHHKNESQCSRIDDQGQCVSLSKAFAYSSHPTALTWRNKSYQPFNNLIFSGPSSPSLRALSLILYI